MDVPSRVEDIAAARHAIVAFLRDHGVPSMIVDDLELVTSELVTNAIVHPAEADGQSAVVRLEVEMSDTVEITVSNVGAAGAIPTIEHWKPAPPLAVSGRGLGIVMRLCDEVAVEQNGEQAVVRCWRRLPDGGATP